MRRETQEGWNSLHLLHWSRVPGKGGSPPRMVASLVPSSPRNQAVAARGGEGDNEREAVSSTSPVPL